MSRSITLLCAAKLHANQLERHLELFEHIAEVKKVLLVRHAEAGERLSKVELRRFSGGAVPLHALGMHRAIQSTLSEEHVDWVVGFNPVPWGSLAHSAAKKYGVNTCISLIGRDYQQIRRWWGRPFLNAVRNADAVTVTGSRMIEGLSKLGVDRGRIHVLPHSVDLKRFVPTLGAKKYDILSVGQLIERKRMDLLIEAVARLAAEGRRLRLAILGKGPLEAELRSLAERRGVASQVDFLEYRDDVEQVFAEAKVFCLASNWEGVPFAMMEAMACGVVPVVTDVGTIGDWVVDGQNGRLVPTGDAGALASCLDEVFGNEEECVRRMRDELIETRQRLSFEQGAGVWRGIFGLSG